MWLLEEARYMSWAQKTKTNKQKKPSRRPEHVGGHIGRQEGRVSYLWSLEDLDLPSWV